MKLYICSRLIRRKFLRPFNIKHLFLVLEDGLRYEVTSPNGIIKIKKSKANINWIKKCKKISYRTIHIPEEILFKILEESIKTLEGKKYRLLYRNCISFAKMFVSYSIFGFTISFIGNLK